MKKFLGFSIVIILLTSCAQEYPVCTTIPIETGAVIECPDGTKSVLYNGQDGKNGQNGEQGIPGENGLNGQDGQNGVDGQDGVNGTNGSKGNKGDKGDSGSNGHSLITNPSVVPNVCTNGGTAIDVFIDVDDSLSFTAGDVYQSTVFSCHGVDGSGVAVAFTFPSNTTCQPVGTNISAAKPSASSNNLRLFNGSLCQGTHIVELSSTGNEEYWVSDNEYFTLEGTNTTGLILRKVTLQ